jgi:hypothetical protein
MVLGKGKAGNPPEDSEGSHCRSEWRVVVIWEREGAYVARDSHSNLPPPFFLGRRYHHRRVINGLETLSVLLNVQWTLGCARHDARCQRASEQGGRWKVRLIR